MTLNFHNMGCNILRQTCLPKTCHTSCRLQAGLWRSVGNSCIWMGKNNAARLEILYRASRIKSPDRRKQRQLHQGNLRNNGLPHAGTAGLSLCHGKIKSYRSLLNLGSGCVFSRDCHWQLVGNPDWLMTAAISSPIFCEGF